MISTQSSPTTPYATINPSPPAEAAPTSPSPDIRPLRPLDAIRAVAHPRPNLALPLDALSRTRPYAASIISLANRRNAYIAADNPRVPAIAAVRPRSAAISWEVSHLYAPDDEKPDAIPPLLETAAASAASSGAERVFLRLLDGAPAVTLARRAGFFPSHRETLYRGSPRAPESGRGLFDANSRLRPRAPQDDHALFRLYNAATPVTARQLYGMTLDQWAASREPAPGRILERVFDADGDVKGIVRTAAPRLGAAILDVELHPDYIALAPDLVDYAARQLSRARAVLSIVPEYAPHLSRALEAHGFEAQADFIVLVKSMARRVGERAPARAVPTIPTP